MDIILIAGLWLDGSAWDAVATELEKLGHGAIPLTLPGQGDGRHTATLEEQVSAVVAAVDAASEPPVVVGHSAASTLAWLAADRRAGRVRSVALVGGFPASDGTAYADFFPTVDGAMPFPGWEPFEGPDSADLDEATRASIAAQAIAVPEVVTKGTVHYTDESRYGVPVLLVCPEFTPEQAKEWVDGGDVPELARAERVEYVDINSGHWPMFTRPAELARLLAAGH